MTGAPRILLSGGGTAGHVAPALAVAAELRRIQPGVELLYIGTADAIEAELVPQAGIRFVAVKVRPLSGRRPLEAARGLRAAGRAIAVAQRVIRTFAPHAALGTGGYVSGPVLAAACLQRVPAAVHEQNLRPGITNRLLSRLVSEVYVSFEASRPFFGRRRCVITTGYPVRPEILAAERESSAQALGLDPALPTLLVMAGSRGALTVSEAAKVGIPKLLGEWPDLQVVLSTGQAYYADVTSALAAADSFERHSRRLLVFPYIHRMDQAYACADLVLCRAGGSTHELLALGLPAILVPSPNVAYDQQSDNARLLHELGAAVVVPDQELDGERLAREVAGLLADPNRLSQMAAAAAAAGRPAAGRELAQRLLSLASRGAKRGTGGDRR